MFSVLIDSIKKLFKKKGKGLEDKIEELPKERQEKIDEKVHEFLIKKAEELDTGYNDGLMHISKEGMIELAGHEGICLNKYKDSVGVWTIGVGATRSEIPDIGSWPQEKSITVQEAFDLMKRSILKYEKGVRRALKVDVPQHTFDALVSWCYNVGVGWCKKATVIKLLNKGVHHSDKRVYNALMMYKKPKEIIPRRKKEAILLTTGKYSNNGRALLFPVSRRGRPNYSRGKSIDVNKYL